MRSRQFTQLSELVKDIKATSDSEIAAIACKALNELLHNDPSGWRDDREG